MIKVENILFDTPEYESYGENEAVLTEEEMVELGMEIKRTCCNKSTTCSIKGKGCGDGENRCNCRKKCCKNK